MTDPRPLAVGIVVKKDGTVPFDNDVHPDVRGRIMAFLTDNGHTFDPVPGTRHVKIKNWRPEFARKWQQRKG